MATVTTVGGTWTFNFAYNNTTGISTTTVTSPPRYDSASKTNISDNAVFTSVSRLNYIQTAQYYAGASTLLRTVSTTYSTDGTYLPLAVTTTLNDSGQSSSVSYQYYTGQYNIAMRNYPKSWVS